MNYNTQVFLRTNSIKGYDHLNIDSNSITIDTPTIILNTDHVFYHNDDLLQIMNENYVYRDITYELLPNVQSSINPLMFHFNKMILYKIQYFSDLESIITISYLTNTQNFVYTSTPYIQNFNVNISVDNLTKIIFSSNKKGFLKLYFKML